MLRKHLRAAQSALLYSDHMEGDAVEAMFRHACAMGDRVKAGDEPLQVWPVRHVAEGQKPGL